MEPTKEELKAAKKALRKEQIALRRQAVNEKGTALLAKRAEKKAALLAKVEELKNN